MAKHAVDIHQALMDPAAYPGPTGPIEHRETHISHLYLTQEFVYKIKKPLNLGFLDFTTLERRRYFCEQELVLNQRLCPDTYHQVVPIGRRGNDIRVGLAEDVLDYAVVMRRLPEDRMLDTLVAANTSDLPAAMDQLGQLLADFHRQARVYSHADPTSNASTVTGNWRENFVQTQAFIGRTLDLTTFNHLQRSVERFLEEQQRLLVQRQQEGFVRDGHGDLHSEHICLTEPIRIYDCIEFNERFRIADIIADLAFLLMDLEFRGRRDLSQLLLASYQARLDLGVGAERLLPFYKLYRAYVRAKVESILSDEAEVPIEIRSAAATRARQYFNLATAYLCQRPFCLLTCGLMGTGKTTLSLALQKVIDADVWRSDVLRKELAGVPANSKCPAPYGLQEYSPTMTRLTYDRLLNICLSSLESGRPAIADAAFSSSAERQRFRQACEERGIPLFIVYLHCPEQETLVRLENRQRDAKDPSDGRPELYHEQASHFSVPKDEPRLIEVDTTRGLTYNVNLVLNSILATVGAVL